MIDIRSNIDQVIGQTNRLLGQHTGAIVRALNTTAFAGRVALQKEMDRVFHPGPTAYIRTSPRVKLATLNQLVAEIYLNYPGGKSVDPDKILEAEVFGGRRRAKRAERAFQRVGILPTGFGMVPQSGAPVDAFGNVPGSFLVQIISYFRAFGEVGYRANLTDKRRSKLANVGHSERGFKSIGGVVYFVSRGFGNTAHLPPGIYAKRGIHGADVKCVFLFVRLPTYQKRLDFYGVLERTVKAYFVGDLRRNLARARAQAR